MLTRARYSATRRHLLRGTCAGIAQIYSSYSPLRVENYSGSLGANIRSSIQIAQSRQFAPGQLWAWR